MIFFNFYVNYFPCSEGSDDSSDTGNNGEGSDNQTVNLFFSEYAEELQ